LLFLYPGDFRKQFSEEMISVFQHRATERREDFRFFLSEFIGIPKGACIMWLARILTLHRNSAPSQAEDAAFTPVTVAELNSQRQTAIKRMVASIATHDFLNARRYSYEEVRLKRIILDLEEGISAPGGSTA
jgi:hypothetical protein